MSPITPVKFTTPDGAERELRLTFGAMRRIADRLGCQLGEALVRYGEGALPEVLYCCMYDRKGNPPEGLNPVEFAETCDIEQANAMLEKLTEACAPGSVKNALEALLKAAKQVQDLTKSLIGSTSGASPDSASESLN